MLSFDHIGKLNFADEGSIEVSIDSGRTWNRVQTVGANSNSFYSGRATNWVNPLAAGTTGNIFNEGSYTGAPGQTVNWNPASPTATSNMWIRESIEISNLCSNAADVRVRFKIERKTPTPNRYGWLLDNIMVTRALSEIDPPVITHAPATTGYQYNTSFVLNAAMKDRTAISSAFVVFSVNSGPFNDSIPMSRVNVTKNSSTGELTYNYRATLATPTFTDGDTVCYYITAFDSSRLRNYGYFPSPIPTCFQFVSSGPPI